jgi:hypothetical protein
MSSRIFAAAIAVALGFAIPSASAEVRQYKADLTGSAEVPSVDTPATGTADVTYDTDSKTLTWKADYKDLKGVFSAAHAPALVNVSDSVQSGSTVLTDAQATDLEAGLWYFNVHSERHPEGEIRGQVLRMQ